MMIGVSDTQPAIDEYSAVGPCLLGPVGDETAHRRAASVAHALAASRDVDLLVSTPPDAEPDSGSGDAVDLTDSLPESHRDGYSSAATGIGDERPLDLLVSQHEPSSVVVKRRGKQHLLGELFSDRAERLSSTTDVLTVDGRGDADRIASILVPVASGPHSGLAVETAVAIARANDAAVDLFHVVESDDEVHQTAGEDVLNTAVAAIDDEDAERVDTWCYTDPNVTDAIIEQSAYYDLTVMGAPTVGPLERFVFGSTSKNVQQEADSPVIVAHAQDGST